MNKLVITSLFAVILLFGCNKYEDDNTIIVDGWKISKSKHGFDSYPTNLFFVNEIIGFVIGNNGSLYKTIDSGRSWRKFKIGSTYDLCSVYFINRDVGFVSGKYFNSDFDNGSILLKTTDGGKTWTKSFFPYYDLILTMKFFDAMNGIAIIITPYGQYSRNLNLATTSNGGESWNLIDLAIKSTNDKLFYVDDLVYVAGEDQCFFKSSDYGHSWDTINSPIKTSHIYFYNENIGYIFDANSLYKTLDGGISWNQIDVPYVQSNTFHFSTENEGLIIETVITSDLGFQNFKGSYCYRTIDGGETWEKSNLIEAMILGKSFFPQRDVGFGFNSSEFYVLKKIE